MQTKNAERAQHKGLLRPVNVGNKEELRAYLKDLDAINFHAGKAVGSYPIWMRRLILEDIPSQYFKNGMHERILEKYEGKGELAAYLNKVFYNLGREVRRLHNNKMRNQYSLDLPSGGGRRETRYFEPAARREDPLAGMQLKQLKKIIANRIQNVPPHNQAIMALLLSEGLRLQKVVQIMRKYYDPEITDTNVLQRVLQVRRRVARDLKVSEPEHREALNNLLSDEKLYPAYREWLDRKMREPRARQA